MESNTVKCMEGLELKNKLGRIPLHNSASLYKYFRLDLFSRDRGEKIVLWSQRLIRQLVVVIMSNIMQFNLRRCLKVAMSTWVVDELLIVIIGGVERICKLVLGKVVLEGEEKSRKFNPNRSYL